LSQARLQIAAAGCGKREQAQALLTPEQPMRVKSVVAMILLFMIAFLLIKYNRYYPWIKTAVIATTIYLTRWQD